MTIIERPMHPRYSAEQRELNVDLKQIQERLAAWQPVRDQLTKQFGDLLEDVEYLLWDASWTRQEILEARA